MIVSRVSDAVWLQLFDTLPAFTPPARSTVILSPHPDDETLGCGGLIAKQRQQGVPVLVVAVTDGENAYPGLSDPQTLATERMQEQTAALASLGVDGNSILRLALPDSGLSGREDDIAASLAPHVSGDTLLVAPWVGDFHPDHEACGRAAERVSAATGAELLYYFFWTWHRGTPETIERLRLERLMLSGDELKRKQLALDAHATQLADPGAGAILPLDLLGPMRWPFEVFARP